LIDLRLLVDPLHVKLSKLNVGLLHAVKGVARNLSVEFVLNWLEMFSDMECDFQFLLLDRNRWLQFSIKCILTVAPSNNGIDV